MRYRASMNSLSRDNSAVQTVLVMVGLAFSSTSLAPEVHFLCLVVAHRFSSASSHQVVLRELVWSFQYSLLPPSMVQVHHNG